jgi:hypothetical protein
MSEEIQTQLDEARADPAYWDASDMGHAASINKVNDLTGKLSSWRDGLPDAISDPVAEEIRPNVSAGEDHLSRLMSAALSDIPQTPEDVNFKVLEDNAPDGLDLDADEAADWRNYLWQLDAPQPVLDGLMTRYVEITRMDSGQYENMKEAAQFSLQQKYGEHYDKAINLAYSAALAVGGQKLVDYMDSTGMGNDWATIEAFIELARKNGHSVYD